MPQRLFLELTDAFPGDAQDSTNILERGPAAVRNIESATLSKLVRLLVGSIDHNAALAAHVQV